MISSAVAKWLASDEAAPAIALAGENVPDGKVSVAVVQQLRKRLSPEQVAAVLELVSARYAVREKFRDAERLYLTRLSGEQATDEAIARYKAGKFARFAMAADIGCGIGGDAMPLSRQSHCVAVERNPTTAIFVAKNLALTGGSFLVFDEDAFAPQAEWTSRMTGDWAWHVDPDRRASGQRVTTFALCEPGPEALRTLLSLSPHGAAKLAPATRWETESWPVVHREWISRGGECRQQVVWFGDLVNHVTDTAIGSRTATVVRFADHASGFEAHSFSGDEMAYLPPAVTLGRWLVEPDAAILAAGLKNTFAAQHQLAPVAEGIGYLTGEQLVDSPLAEAFEVIERWPFDARKVGEALRRRDIGTVEIKKRGVEVSPETLRKQWQLKGSLAATVILTPTTRGVVALLCRRMG